MKERCSWCGDDPLYKAYHDQEWGVPIVDDQKLFEFLILEGMQAGLSWLTILRKRDNFRRAFSKFHPERISRFTDERCIRLLNNKGIIRNRLKIKSVIGNACAYLTLLEYYPSFSNYLWQFTDYHSINNNWKCLSDVPTNTPQSDAMAKDLKKRGFKFVGTTICYAFMQAVGMVNDHLVHCYRHEDITSLVFVYPK